MPERKRFFSIEVFPKTYSRSLKTRTCIRTTCLQMNICWKLQNVLLQSLEGRQCRKLPTSGQNCSHIVTTRAIPSLLLKKNLLRHFVQQSNQFHLYFWAKLLTYSCNNFISVLQHSFLRLLKKISKSHRYYQIRFSYNNNFITFCKWRQFCGKMFYIGSNQEIARLFSRNWILKDFGGETICFNLSRLPHPVIDDRWNEAFPFAGGRVSIS